jgi:Protein of unknown function (DUF2786)/SprT-like family
MNVESLWAAQLLKEHEEISWYHRASLRPPVIRIEELKSVWGTWNAFTRVITINRQLIVKHSWDVVLEVLKHEMAHQYVSEVLGFNDDTAHGATFKKACAVLGVSSWAASAAGGIPDVIPTLRERVLSPEDERLLSKVEKLLSLAQSSNEHEALRAMEKVKELYSIHRLDRLKRQSSNEEMDSIYLTNKKKKISRPESKIFQLLVDHFRVKVIQTSLYDAGDLVRYKAAEVLGRRENVLMAEYVFAFLMAQIDGLWASHKKLTKCPGTLRESFQLGVLSGFGEKLSLVKADVAARAGGERWSDADEKSLVVLERNELSDFVSRKYPRLAKKSLGRRSLDAASFASGQTHGRSLTLNRPISAGKGFGGFLRS